MLVYLIRIIEGQDEYDFKYVSSEEKAITEVKTLSDRNKVEERSFIYIPIKVH